MRCAINRRYIPLKLIYLFFMAGESCALLYRSVFMKHLGMSTKQTGIIWTMERVVSVILPPFIGAITDKTRRPKLFLIILLLGGSVTLFSMYFIPQEEYIESGLHSPVADKDIAQGNNSFCWSLYCDISVQCSASDHKMCIIKDPRRDEKHCHQNVTDVITLACNNLCYDGPNTTAETHTKLENSGKDSLNSTSLLTSTNYTSDKLWKCHFLSGHVNFSSPKLAVTQIQADQLYSFVQQGSLYLTTSKDNPVLCVFNGIIKEDEKSNTCNELIPNDVDEYGVTFWILIITVFVSSFATIGTYPIMETSVLAALGPKNRHKFGQQRLWASVGFGSAALIIGYLRDRSAESIDDVGSNRAFLSMFVGVLICWFCAAVVSGNLPITTGKRSEPVRLKDIKKVLKKVKALAFFGLVLFYGADNAVQEIYLFWLAEVKLNAPSFILGASTFVGAILDIPFCLAAGRLVRKFGHAPLICFGLNIYGLRLILCALVTEPWQLIATESLRCITWGLTWVVVLSYTAKISPKDLETSTMGLTQAMLWGVGYSVGALLGGVLFQTIGGDKVFLFFGVATLCAATLFGIFSFFNRNHDEGEEVEKNETAEHCGSNDKIESAEIGYKLEEMKLTNCDLNE